MVHMKRPLAAAMITTIIAAVFFTGAQARADQHILAAELLIVRDDLRRLESETNLPPLHKHGLGDEATPSPSPSQSLQDDSEAPDVDSSENVRDGDEASEESGESSDSTDTSTDGESKASARVQTPLLSRAARSDLTPPDN